MRRGNKLLLYLFFLSPKILCILSLRQMQTASYYVVSYSLRSFCKASRYFESTEIQYVFLIRNGSSPFPSWLRSSFITAVSEELSSLKISHSSIFLTDRHAFVWEKSERKQQVKTHFTCYHEYFSFLKNFGSIFGHCLELMQTLSRMIFHLVTERWCLLTRVFLWDLLCDLEASDHKWFSYLADFASGYTVNLNTRSPSPATFTVRLTSFAYENFGSLQLWLSCH